MCGTEEATEAYEWMSKVAYQENSTFWYESIWETVRLTISGHLKMMLVPQSLAELEKPKEIKTN